MAWTAFLLVAGLAANWVTAEPLTVDVAIIGAGYSGLTAAYTLQQHSSNPSFHVIEATGRVGGRTLNFDVATRDENTISDDVIELGGEWLAPSQTHAINLMRQFNLELFHRPFNRRLARSADSRTDNSSLSIVVHSSQGTSYVASDDDILATLPPRVQRQIETSEQKFVDLARQVPCDKPLSNASKALDGITYSQWVIDSGSSDPEAQHWLTEFADDAEDVRSMSMLGVAWTYNCSDGVVGSSTEDWYRVRGGTQAAAMLMAQQMKYNLTLNSPVRKVSEHPGYTLVESDNLTVRAEHVLIAGVPPPVLLGIAFNPPLNRDTYQLLSRLSLGTCLKYMVVYSSPWWRKKGYLGENLQ